MTDAADAAPNHLLVEADGGSRGNPGVAGYGALVRDPDSGNILDVDAAPLGTASNNVAEYSGLIAGLQLAERINPKASVLVRMDSKLVVEQMTGRWKIKHADMKRLATEARQILPADQVSYEWIPRDQNKDADQLSNEAMDAGAADTSWDRASSTVGASATTTGVASTETADSGAPVHRIQPARLHHIEIWVADQEIARNTLGWLFTQLGYEISGEWSAGTSYQGAGEYIVLEHGPDVANAPHDRTRPGLNHLAFYAGSRQDVDQLTEAAQQHGFTVLFPDQHPFAGGHSHYAAYLESSDGFEIELVAED